MAKYLLDTNHLSATLPKVSRLRDRLWTVQRQGHRLATSWSVLCELELGLLQLAKPENYRRTLKIILREVAIWPFDWDMVRLHGESALLARKRGRVLSHVDLVLVALARHHSATILSTDGDYAAFPEIRTENWLA